MPKWVEDCVKAIKKKQPGIDESKAWAICQAQYKKLEQGENMSNENFLPREKNSAEKQMVKAQRPEHEHVWRLRYNSMMNQAEGSSYLWICDFCNIEVMSAKMPPHDLKVEYPKASVHGSKAEGSPIGTLHYDGDSGVLSSYNGSQNIQYEGDGDQAPPLEAPPKKWTEESLIEDISGRLDDTIISKKLKELNTVPKEE